MKASSSRHTHRFLSCALALVSALVLISCWTPIYDPAASLSMGFVKNLEQVSRIGPVSVFDGDLPSYLFVPRREEYPDEGYLVGIRDDYAAVGYVQRDGGGDFRVMAHWGNWHEPGVQIAALSRPVPSTLLEDRSLVLLLSRGSSGVFLLSYAAGVISAPYAPNWTTPDPSQRLIATGISSYSGGAASIGYLRTQTTPTPLMSNFQIYDTTNGTTSPTGMNNNTYSGPDLYGPGFYAFSADNAYHYFAAHEASGRLRAYRWNHPPSIAPTELVGVDRMPTALLQDKRLLAEGALDTLLFGPLGERIGVLRTGSAHFSHEHLVGGTWYCYFTRVTRIEGKDGSTVYIDIYRHPSSGLADLAE